MADQFKWGGIDEWRAQNKVNKQESYTTYNAKSSTFGRNRKPFGFSETEMEMPTYA